MTRTMSVRMDQDNYEFLQKLSKDEKEDLSSALRDLVSRGRVMLAIDRYRNGQASLGKAAELAGMPLGRMMTLLESHGIESNIEQQDYLQGAANLRKLL
jgi:predicted HTH domain antitoxin